MRTQYAGFSEDAQKAIAENPAYFVRWYTIKSIGLGVVAAVAAYYIGKDVMRGSMARKSKSFSGLIPGVPNLFLWYGGAFAAYWYFNSLKTREAAAEKKKQEENAMHPALLDLPPTPKQPTAQAILTPKSEPTRAMSQGYARSIGLGTYETPEYRRSLEQEFAWVNKRK